MTGATFSGKKIRTFVLNPGEAACWMPPHFEEFVLASTVKERRRLSVLPLQLSAKHLDLLSLFHLKAPNETTLGALEDSITPGSQLCSATVGHYSIDLISDGSPACGGVPRGGILSTEEKRMVMQFPIPNPDDALH